MGMKDRYMRPQEKWKLESPKEGDENSKNMKNKTYNL